MIAVWSNNNMILKLTTLFLCIILTGLVPSTFAVENSLDFKLSSSKLTYLNTKSFMLVANESDVVAANTSKQVAKTAEEFEPPLFTKRKTHQYLGLTTIALAGLTAITAPEDCDSGNCPPRDVTGTHATLAKATIAMAVATIATGLYAHWDDFHVSDGWADPDNLHVLLGITGATMMAYAVNKSANSSVPVSHAGIAEAGAVLMVVAIKLTW